LASPWAGPVLGPAKPDPWEDVLDRDDLRHDPMMAVLAGTLAARRKNCAPVAGKSTRNRLELGRPEPTADHKIGHDPRAIETLLVDLFVNPRASAAADHPRYGKPHQGMPARPVCRPHPCSGQGQACMGRLMSSAGAVDFLWSRQ